MAGTELLPYFVGKSEKFLRSADIILILDTGEELPVHSALLCAQSQVFCDMLAIDEVPKAICQESPRKLSLTDCSRDAACSWLSYIYDPRRQCSDVEAEGVLELAHKFDMQALLEIFDDFLAGEIHPSLWEDYKKALQWLVLADRCNLKKLVSRIISYLAASSNDISSYPEAQQLPSSILLQLLHTQHLTIEHQKASAQALEKENDSVRTKQNIWRDLVCIDQPEKFRDAITAAEKSVDNQERQCDRRVVCRKCEDKEYPCRACDNLFGNMFDRLRSACD